MIEDVIIRLPVEHTIKDINEMTVVFQGKEYGVVGWDYDKARSPRFELEIELKEKK